jgi:hypothetical protein
VATSPAERGADGPGQRSQAGADKRWHLGGGLPHSTKDNTDAAVRAEIGAISTRGVFDPLGTLNDKRIIIRRIQPARSPSRDKHRAGVNHQHLIWRTCSRMVNLDGAVRRHPTRDGRRGLGLPDLQS